MHAKTSLFVPVVKGMAIEKWVNVTSGDRDALKVALAKHGPISVGIDAAHKSLSFYSNGVYYEPKCGNTTDALVRYILTQKFSIKYKENQIVKKTFFTNSPKQKGLQINCVVMLSMLYLAFHVGKSKLVEENSYSGHFLIALALLATPVRSPWVLNMIMLSKRS